MAQDNNNAKYLNYLGKPFVRVKNTIYYGEPTDPCIVELKVLDTKTVDGIELANRVSVKLMSTEMLGLRPEVYNSTEKIGLYSAMDIASIWLQRKLRELSAETK